MKTTNNVQKVVLKSLAVIVSSVLISFTVSAQGFWESILENNTFNEIALAMVESNSEAESNLYVSYSSSEATNFELLLEAEVEELLELEDWMTNEANFLTSYSIEEAIETPMELEDWMTDETYFSESSLSLEVVVEEALEIEDWMLDTENFSVENTSFEHTTAKEYELELEPWMTNSKVWEN